MTELMRIRLPGQAELIRATAGQVWQGRELGLELVPDGHAQRTYQERFNALSDSAFNSVIEHLLAWDTDAAARQRRLTTASRLLAHRAAPDLYRYIGEL